MNSHEQARYSFRVVNLLFSSYSPLFLFSVLTIGPIKGGLIEHVINPADTHPLVSPHQAAEFHHACLETDTPQLNKLMVFIPGTLSNPLEYQEFSKTAASLGYHTIAIKYPSNTSVGSVCNTTSEDAPDCHAKAREEIVKGVDTSPHFSVAPHNSIYGRLFYLLYWLDVTYPSEGWGQYIAGFEFQWQKFALCGHSQGGGHALFIARENKVDRCVSFSGFDWYEQGNRPADWLTDSFATPVDSLYAFVHLRDEGINFENITLPTVATLEISRYGPHAIAENLTTKQFEGTHFLATDLEPARSASEGGLHHNVAVLDHDLTYHPDGTTPIMKEAWRYLLTHETKPVHITYNADEARIYFSPGILRFSTDLETWVNFPYPFTPSPLVVPINSPAWPHCGFYTLEPVP